MQRHLPALEADLVEAAGARLLSLVAAAGGLAPARAATAADAVARATGALGGAELVQFHDSLVLSVLDADQVVDPVDHAAHRGRVGELAHLVQLLQAEAPHGVAVLLLAAGEAFHQLHLDLLHAVISSTFLPRRAAISAGVLIDCRPFSVARTTL